MDATDDFLSKHCYHLSILNAAKLLDIFNPVVNDGIIIAEKLGKGKILKNTPSYALYYNSNLVDLSIISDSVAASFFDTLHFIQYYFQKNEEDLSTCLSRLTDFF
jgi:lipid-binding SYLF domain-containing protein